MSKLVEQFGDKAGNLKNNVDGKSIKEHDYRGIFTPGRKEITELDSDSVDTKNINKNVFNLNDYFWYPENFSNILINKDVFNNSDDLMNKAPDEGTGYLGMIINEFQNSFDKITSFFDKKKNNPRTPIDVILSDVPHLKIYEYQPVQETTSFLNNMKMIYNILDNMIGKSDDGRSTLDKMKQVFSEEGLDNIIKESMGNNASSTDPTHIQNVIHIPNWFYEHMIGGTYTASYKLPFFNKTEYLNAMGQSGWSSRSMKQQFFGNFLSGLIDKIPGIGQFDIAGKPKFSLEGNNPLHDPITTSFYLHNYNFDALISNLALIYSLVSGAFWIQNKFLQQSSNLYDVEVPGRFRYYLCKCNIKVDFYGKVRQLNDSQIAEIQKNFPKITNKDAISKVPDSYLITLDFASLLPNNFNIFLDYLIGRNKINVGQYVEGKGSKFGSSVMKTLKSTNQHKADTQNQTGSQNESK